MPELITNVGKTPIDSTYPPINNDIYHSTIYEYLHKLTVYKHHDIYCFQKTDELEDIIYSICPADIISFILSVTNQCVSEVLTYLLLSCIINYYSQTFMATI